MGRKSKNPGPDLDVQEEAALERELTQLPLPTAVLAAFTGHVGRRWTVGELERKFQSLGIAAARSALTVALSELEAHLAENDFLPWLLIERGAEWFLVPKSMMLAAVESSPALPAHRTLSDEEKAVLVVIIGHRKRGGVTKTRISEILGISDVDPILAGLEKDGLIYPAPGRMHAYWRARPATLLALGIRAHTEVPALRELESYFEGKKHPRGELNLARTARLERGARKRRRVQAASLPSPVPDATRVG